MSSVRGNVTRPSNTSRSAVLPLQDGEPGVAVALDLRHEVDLPVQVLAHGGFDVAVHYRGSADEAQACAATLREAGEMLFEASGKPPRFKSVSPQIFTYAERALGLGAGLSDWFAEKAEYARIARYYATESMLVRDPATGEYSADLTPEFGQDTLEDHYRRLLAGV